MTTDKLLPDMWYLISAPAAGQLTMTAGDTTISVAYAAGQTAFYAITNVAEYGDGCILSGPFAKAPAGNGGGLTPEERDTVLTTDGESVAPPEDDGLNPSLPMVHATWVALRPEIVAVAVEPATTADRVLTMQMLLTPAANLATGWLAAANGATLEWVGGEPYLVAGYSYIVTLVQVSPARILANLNMPFTALT